MLNKKFSQKSSFWEALLVTALIFGIGVFMGVILENWRTNKIDLMSQQSEIELLDVRLQNEIYAEGNFNCSIAVKENFEFADRIYKEAELLERYDKASRITEYTKFLQKKYDILRAILLINSQKIRKTCTPEYHEVVYIYDYLDPPLEKKELESVFANFLNELKNKEGNKILLIPFAGDNNLSSINLILNQYSVSEKDLPIIIIDSKYKIQKAEDLQKIYNFTSQIQ